MNEPGGKSYPKDLKPLTGFRFFAAAAILVFHYNLAVGGGIVTFDRAGGITGRGYLAVDFFFVLSGFILSHVYADGLGGRLSIRDFYAKRFARLYPVHLAMLLLTGFAGYAVPPGAAATGALKTAWLFLTNLLLIHAWGVNRGDTFNTASWSISAEWFAYLCFPFLVPLALNRRPVFWLLAAAGFFGLLWLPGLLPHIYPLTARTYDFGILRIAPEFLLGMAAYRVGRSHAVPAGLAPLACCTLLIFGLAWLRWPDLFIVLGFVWLILIGAERARQVPGDPLGHPALVYLGEISYSLYMVHYLCLIGLVSHRLLPAAGAPFGYAAGLAVFFGVSLLGAALSYHLVEHPARAWLTRRFIAKPP